ncbi:hypothetical protein B0H15DRAFT_957835 [Mycena belliarum]|uniref:Uncharacterized protein n=1 Tax=Mycena belliarum TaxID=1033014 RepID=A0AAD6XDZ3_9AGAR|nr:hypothetical protein B0H15DRAFT_957835 [Mycena belliae]
MGLMQGMEIVKDRTTKDADEQLATALSDRMLELGLNANEELDAGLAIIAEAFRTTPGANVMLAVHGH